MPISGNVEYQNKYFMIHVYQLYINILNHPSLMKIKENRQPIENFTFLFYQEKITLFLKNFSNRSKI